MTSTLPNDLYPAQTGIATPESPLAAGLAVNLPTVSQLNSDAPPPAVTRPAEFLAGMTVCDRVEWMRLTDLERGSVQAWKAALEAPGKPVQAWLDGLARRFGVSPATARRKWDAWRHTNGDWRAIADRRSVAVAGPSQVMPVETVEYVCGLALMNGRKSRPAWRLFERQWKSGAPLPGVPPGLPRYRLPRGYSYRAWLRQRPSDFELKAVRVGRGAAAAHRPLVYTTRVGLHVGEVIMFDDLWHDFKVVMLGQREPMRLLQLHAHDLYSACQFARGIKPRLEDPDTGRRLNLTEDEMLFLLAHVLTEYGYYRGGCVLVVEHGTAAVREDIEADLDRLTGGLVRVERSAILGASAFAGQYGGAPKGNYRFKAALESSHNLVHNETAGLLEFPGQTGSNSRLNAPEELHGREGHCRALVKAMASLPAEVAAQLAMPFLEVGRAVDLLEEVQERINQRTEHELEGWIEAGLTTVQYLIDGRPLEEARVRALEPAQREALVAAGMTAEVRRLSPREVFNAGRADLVRFRPEQAAALLCRRQGREVTVRDHVLEFEDRALSPGPLRYLAHHWAEGDKFKVVVNPFALGVAHLFDARGRWVGTCEAWGCAPRLDVKALREQQAKAARVERQLLRQVEARCAPATERRIAASVHNSRVAARVLDGDHALAEQADAALENLFCDPVGSPQ